MTSVTASSGEVSFQTQDGGLIFADLYGTSERAVVLAHGARFDKASWKPQAEELAKAGYRVLAIDFRGYGKSRGGPKAKNSQEEMFQDILAAVTYLRTNSATSVSVVGASMGGGAAANAVIKGPKGAIDRLVLLAHAPVREAERIAGPKLFVIAEGDPIAAQVREQYGLAPEPKEMLVLDGSAHAQFLFKTAHGQRLMREMLRFLSATLGAVH
jgi:pimeloyl-ACP methyl ester carboxylesterase